MCRVCKESAPDCVDIVCFDNKAGFKTCFLGENYEPKRLRIFGLLARVVITDSSPLETT